MVDGEKYTYRSCASQVGGILRKPTDQVHCFQKQMFFRKPKYDKGRREEGKEEKGERNSKAMKYRIG